MDDLTLSYLMAACWVALGFSAIYGTSRNKQTGPYVNKSSVPLELIVRTSFVVLPGFLLGAILMMQHGFSGATWWMLMLVIVIPAFLSLIYNAYFLFKALSLRRRCGWSQDFLLPSISPARARSIMLESMQELGWDFDASQWPKASMLRTYFTVQSPKLYFTVAGLHVSVMGEDKNVVESLINTLTPKVESEPVSKQMAGVHVAIGALFILMGILKILYPTSSLGNREDCSETAHVEDDGSGAAFYEHALSCEVDKQDIAGAIFWYSKAAEAGHHASMFSLSKIYRENEQFLDLTKSDSWQKKHAQQEHPASFYESHCKYGLDQMKSGKNSLLYWYGASCLMNGQEEAGVTLFSELATRGDKVAGIILGDYYRGVNPVKAKEWYEYAKSLGSQVADERISQLLASSP